MNSLNNTDSFKSILDQIHDEDFKNHMDSKLSEFKNLANTIISNNYYEIKLGSEMFLTLLEYHNKCNKDSKIYGLQTILESNMDFLDTPNINRFHSETERLIKEGCKVKRILMVEKKLLKSKVALSKIVKNYFKPQLDSGVEITIHEFNDDVNRIHPGHDFTLFEITDNEKVSAEGGSIYKQTHEIGYAGRIWKNDDKYLKLTEYFNTLYYSPTLEIPPEILKNLPSIFIGSSSEGIEVAEQLQVALSNIADVTVWSQGVFGLSKGTLESILDASKKADFAILVLSPDDLTISRNKEKSSPRDNVIFELGLFMGHLGLQRTYFVYNEGVSIDLPSDLAGITAATYPDYSNFESSINVASKKIKNEIKKLWN